MSLLSVRNVIITLLLLVLSLITANSYWRVDINAYTESSRLLLRLQNQDIRLDELMSRLKNEQLMNFDGMVDAVKQINQILHALKDQSEAHAGIMNDSQLSEVEQRLKKNAGYLSIIRVITQFFVILSSMCFIR